VRDEAEDGEKNGGRQRGYEELLRHFQVIEPRFHFSILPNGASSIYRPRSSLNILRLPPFRSTTSSSLSSWSPGLPSCTRATRSPLSLRSRSFPGRRACRSTGPSDRKGSCPRAPDFRRAQQR